jgi:hypothetical protein
VGGAAFTGSPAEAVIVCHPSTDVCIYDDANFGGLLAAWPASATGRMNLLAARDHTSSWTNLINGSTGFVWCAYDQRTGLPDTYLWTLFPSSQDPYVGDNVNDRADYFVRC